MASARLLPLYEPRSKVRALKIKAVTYSREPLEGVPRGESLITPADERYAPFWVNEPWAMKNRPQPGGYFVVHADGHQSFYPANAFESGYSRLED